MISSATMKYIFSCSFFSIFKVKLNELSARKRNALLHTYRHSFSGFSARLSEEEAHSIAQKPGVVSVFPDPLFQLHTTRSWDFLKYQADLEIDSNPGSDSGLRSQGSDTIIGIMDTGIWPESESFNDKDMDPIPSRWKGTCMQGKDFSSSNCNKKLIGARFYHDPDDTTAENHSPRDRDGHGTHVASTAAGNVVPGASYYGLATGRAKGGFPGARIAVYRVCTPQGCHGSGILAAFDDAIADGVDVLSLSLGAPSSGAPDFSNDPIAIGAFHAVENGIPVVCSAGNDGPAPESVVNTAPWILTVAASTIDRDFETDVVLGDNKVIKGESITFPNIEKSPVYPLVYGKSAKRKEAEERDARNCNPETMEENQIKGKIVLCYYDEGPYSEDDRIEEVRRLGGIGMILVNDITRAVASTYGSFPMTVIASKDAADILSYINSTRNLVATILPTTVVTKFKPAPDIAYFSSRGPAPRSRNLLKPDIAAPGVNILASWVGNDTQGVPAGQEPSLFNLLSGTSMACPHVSGIVATVKSRNPTWSPSAIKSAIMTTATQTNNLKGSITTDLGAIATPYDYGAGEVTTTVFQPGLVYETSTIDYLNFLCHHGYNLSRIKHISKDIPAGFTCPADLSADYISDMNYPSIAIFKFDGKERKKVSRIVTNVGEDEETVYTVSVDGPSRLQVKVIPEKLKFTQNCQKLSYHVIFTSTTSSMGEDAFGSITWTNGKYRVRSPFVISNKGKAPAHS